MIIKRILPTYLVGFLASFLFSNNALAIPDGFADVVVEYFDSGAGSLSCPEGQGGQFTTVSISTGCVPLSVTLGSDLGFPVTPADYLSLPIGSFITLGFTDEVIVDGVGNDIFIQEVGDAQELADIFVSETLSTDPNDFIFLGQANGNTISSFDLASIGFTGQVRAVKIVSLANGGFPSAPGFDLANVEALSFEASSIPAPSTSWIFGAAIGALGLIRRRVPKRH
jgi:hypothetical protein